MKTAEEILFKHFNTEGPMAIFKTSVLLAMKEYGQEVLKDSRDNCAMHALRHGYYKGLSSRIDEAIESYLTGNGNMEDFVRKIILIQPA